MNFFHHKDLGNHLLQLCPKVVKHPVYAALLFTHVARNVTAAVIMKVISSNSLEFVRYLTAQISNQVMYMCVSQTLLDSRRHFPDTM